MASVGLAFPGNSATVWVVTTKGMPEKKTFAELLEGHTKSVIFGVPGPFTPACTEKHLPGFVAQAEVLHAAG
eukprot:gene26794-34975_t